MRVNQRARESRKPAGRQRTRGFHYWIARAPARDNLTLRGFSAHNHNLLRQWADV